MSTTAVTTNSFFNWENGARAAVSLVGLSAVVLGILTIVGRSGRPFSALTAVYKGNQTAAILSGTMMICAGAAASVAAVIAFRNKENKERLNAIIDVEKEKIDQHGAEKRKELDEQTLAARQEISGDKERLQAEMTAEKAKALDTLQQALPELQAKIKAQVDETLLDMRTKTAAALTTLQEAQSKLEAEHKKLSLDPEVRKKELEVQAKKLELEKERLRLDAEAKRAEIMAAPERERVKAYQEAQLRQEETQRASIKLQSLESQVTRLRAQLPSSNWLQAEQIELRISGLDQEIRKIRDNL
jgi:hypothetical protein